MAYPVVLVVGGTGQQGGAVIRHLLYPIERETSPYLVRVPTRNPNSSKSKALRRLGVDVIECDVRQADDLARAFKDVDYAFCMTDSTTMYSHETIIGKRMVDAAVSAGVKHLIWSSLPNAEVISGNKYKLREFTDKALVDEYLWSQSGLSATVVQPAFFASDWEIFPRNIGTEEVEFVLPIGKRTVLPFIDLDDLGKAVTQILSDPSKFKGKTIPLAGEDKSLGEYLQDFKTVVGKKVTLHTVSYDKFAKELEGEEWVEIFAYVHEYSFFGPEVSDPAAVCQQEGLTCKTVKEWLARNESFLGKLTGKRRAKEREQTQKKSYFEVAEAS